MAFAEKSMISIAERRYSILSVVAMVLVTALLTFLNCRPSSGGLCVDWGFPFAFLTRTDVMINHEWQYLHNGWAILIDGAFAAALVFGVGRMCERILKGILK